MWKVSKYGFFSDPYFPVFSPNTGKHRPEKTPYLGTFHVVKKNYVKDKNFRGTDFHGIDFHDFGPKLWN